MASSAVKYREPDGGGHRIGPVYPVAAVRDDIDPIPGTKKTGVGLILEPQPCGAGEHQHPFAIRLVVPEPGRARLAARDDPFDAQTGPRQQRIEALGGPDTGKPGKHREEVHEPAPAGAGGTAAST